MAQAKKKITITKVNIKKLQKEVKEIIAKLTKLKESKLMNKRIQEIFNLITILDKKGADIEEVLENAI